LQKLRKIPLGGILGEFRDIFVIFLVFGISSKFYIFFKFKIIMFEKTLDEKLFRV
jgi:hypothetical protein